MNLGSILKSLRPFMDGMFLLRRKDLQRVSQHIKGDLLEVGVGQGPDLEFFKSLPGVRSYTGCDREEFTSTYQRGKRPAEIVYYRGDRLPFEDASFDTALSIDCAEHITAAGMQAYFDEIGRVLRPGGCLVASAPFVYPEHCTPYDYWRYTRFGLRQYVEKASLEVTRVTSRSTTLETLLVIANHRLFNSVFPHVLVKHFGVAEQGSLTAEVLKTLALPVTASIYGVGSMTLVACATFGQPFRDASPFSLGYTLVFQKPSSPKQSS